MQVLAEVERSGFVESRHHGVVAVCDADGNLVASAGDPELVTFPRSTGKPFQALAVHRLGTVAKLGLPEASVAVACGSHLAQAVHVEAVLATLAAAGLGETDLRCPAALPGDAAARDAARTVGERRVFHNCSGKHAFMLAGAATRGWATDRYLVPEHPLQAVITDTLAEYTGVPVGQVGVDGCGAPVHALPVHGVATAYARLAARARGDDPDAAAVVGAALRNPVLLRGAGGLDSAVPAVTGGRLLAKVGAEAVYGAANLVTGEGLCLKVDDGGARAAGPALLAVLRALDWLGEAEYDALLPLAAVPVTGGGGVVGTVRPARVALDRP